RRRPGAASGRRPVVPQPAFAADRIIRGHRGREKRAARRRRVPGENPAMFARHTAVIALLSLVGLTAPTVRAQEPDQPQPHGYTAVLDNIDLLIDHYTNFLSRKYELTSEQDAYTRHLLRERAHQ